MAKLRQPGGATIMPGAGMTFLPGATTTFLPDGSTTFMPGGTSLAVINDKTAWLPSTLKQL